MVCKPKRAKRQNKVLEHLERKRLIQKLRKQRDGAPVSEEEIEEALVHSRMERLSALLPQEKSKNGGGDHRAGPKGNPKLALHRLPHLALKKHVHWLALPLQDASSDLTLTEEIQLFAEYVALDQAEIEARENLLNDIQEAVLAKWPGAVVQTFGSFSAGLSIFLSDVDVSVLNVGIEHSTSAQNLLAMAGEMVDEDNRQEVVDLTGEDSFPSHDNAIVVKDEEEEYALDNERSLEEDDEEERDNEEDDLDDESEEEEEEEEENAADEEDGKASKEDEEEEEEVREVTWEIDPRPAQPDLVEQGQASASLLTTCADDIGEDSDVDLFISTNTQPLYSSSISSNSRPSSPLLARPAAGPDCAPLPGTEGAGVTQASPADKSIGKKRKMGMDDLSCEDDEDLMSIGPSDVEEANEKEALLVHHALNAKEKVNKHIHYETPEGEDYWLNDTSAPAERIVDQPQATSEKPPKRRRAEVAEDLDVQILDPDSSDLSRVVHPKDETLAAVIPSGTMSLASQGMDFTNAFPVEVVLSRHPSTTSLTAAGDAATSRETELRKHRKQQQLLRTLHSFIHSLGWVTRLELRVRARVPIINLTHVSSVQGDISLGLAAKDTSEIVRALVRKAGPRILALSAFLKVYLYQLHLDKPFTGGLGSFKLYLLLTKHIERYERMVQRSHRRKRSAEGESAALSGEQNNSIITAANDEQGKTVLDVSRDELDDDEKNNLGLILLTFLQFYGKSENLNESTVVEAEGAQVSFERTTLLPQICAAFQRAYEILLERCRRHGKIDDQPSNAVRNSQISCSFLAPLLDTVSLAKERQACRQKCAACPLRTEEDKMVVAEEIMRTLILKQQQEGNAKNRHIDNSANVRAMLLRAKEHQRALYTRLRSYYSPEALSGKSRRSSSVSRKADAAEKFDSRAREVTFLPGGVVGKELLPASSSSVTDSKDWASNKKVKNGGYGSNYGYGPAVADQVGEAASANQPSASSSSSTVAVAVTTDEGNACDANGDNDNQPSSRAEKMAYLSAKMDKISSTINALKMKLIAKQQAKKLF